MGFLFLHSLTNTHISFYEINLADIVKDPSVSFLDPFLSLSPEVITMVNIPIGVLILVWQVSIPRQYLVLLCVSQLHINGILLWQKDMCLLFHSTLCLRKAPGWYTKTNSIHFHLVAPFHCMDTARFIYSCSCWGMLGYFLFFKVTNWPAMDVPVYVC